MFIDNLNYVNPETRTASRERLLISVVGLTACNRLPSYLHWQYTATFKRYLKTHLFALAF